jgi:hypothetical protein
MIDSAARCQFCRPLFEAFEPRLRLTTAPILSGLQPPVPGNPTRLGMCRQWWCRNRSEVTPRSSRGSEAAEAAAA